MKIIVAHEIFPPEFSGGAEKLLLEILLRLKNSHKVVVITTGNPSVTSFRGIKTVRIPIHRMLFNFLSLPYLLTYAKQADIVIGNTYHSSIPIAFTSLLQKKPSICIVHGAYGKKWLKIKGVLGVIAILLEKIIFKLPFNKFLFFSEFAKNEALKLGVDKRKSVVLYPGINKKRFKRRKKKKFVLFVGRLEKQKGIDILIKVAKKIPHIKFIVVGKGREKIGNFPKNIRYKGFIAEKELTKLYESALLFFLPSRAETLGYSILEAMAAGCAVVSTVALPYYGYRILEGDTVEKIAKKIEDMIRNYKQTKKLGEKNIKIAKNFSWKKFVNRFNKLINTLVIAEDTKKTRVGV